AYMMAKIPLVLKLLQHGKTPLVVEAGRLLHDRCGRARADARAACAASIAVRLTRRQIDVGKHRIVAHPGAELRVDKQIIAAYPAYTGRHPHMLMGNMALLVLP